MQDVLLQEVQDHDDPNQHQSATPTGTSVVVAEETEDLGDRFDRLLCFIPVMSLSLVLGVAGHIRRQCRIDRICIWCRRSAVSPCDSSISGAN